MTTGEIARFEQFLLLSKCFQESSPADLSKCVCRWERVILENTFPRVMWAMPSEAASEVQSHKMHFFYDQKGLLCAVLL